MFVPAVITATRLNNAPVPRVQSPDTRNGLAGLLDRVDIFVEVPRIDYEKLADDRLGEKSEKVQARVTASRKRQQERFKGTKLNSNADMTAADVREYCRVEDSAQSLLKAAMKQLNLSARAFHRILKLARTIADHEDADIIKAPHLAEAIQYRPRSLMI
jgi:magnesium chelatase family protein